MNGATLAVLLLLGIMYPRAAGWLILIFGFYVRKPARRALSMQLAARFAETISRSRFFIICFEGYCS
jgi:hypothetical protein